MKNLKNIFLFLCLTSTLLIVSCGKETQETTPVRKEVSETVFASGILEADGKYTLMAQSNGYITKLNFDEGELINKGSTLVEIKDDDSKINLNGANKLLNIAKENARPNAPLLLQAKTNIAIAKEKMEQDRLIAERYERLWKKNSIAKIDYENKILQYDNAKKNHQIALDNYDKVQNDANQIIVNNQTTKQLYASATTKSKVKALQAGKVYKRYKSLGDYVRAGEVIAEIANPELIYALVNIDESNIAKINLGQPATIQLNTNKEKSYQAKVEEILPSFDEATQSFLCKLYFTDELDFRIINTQLQSNIRITEPKNVLLIPRNYIDFGGYVQIKGEEEKTKVETKFVSSDWVQVLDGIDENVTLITDNIKSSK